jgi:RNA polymerase sigma-70 factor (ECF subfamily)
VTSSSGHARFAQLYRQHGAVIYARCRRMLGNDQDAEDATQETFLRVARHLESAPDGGEALRWIYRIATNHCLNVLRAGKARPAPVPHGEPASPHPESALADRDFTARVFRKAPPNVGAVAWLHHIDGMPQGEVAEVLGISRRTVVTRIAEFAGAVRQLAAGRN